MAKFSVDRYDNDELFNYTDTNEEMLANLNDKHIIHYRTKTIKSGNVLECEVYPIWNTRSSLYRGIVILEARNLSNVIEVIVPSFNSTTAYFSSDIIQSF